jgi:deferrochelatase/peroxidase EfeB
MTQGNGYPDSSAAVTPRRQCGRGYERSKGTGDPALREAVARLLAAVEAIELPTLNVLVGIGWSGLTGHAAHKELAQRHPTIPTLLEPLKPGAKLRVATPGDVIVQVAAELETDRLFALRLASALLTPAANLVEESLGVRRGVGREAFGYRDGRKGSDESYSRDRVLELALIESGAARGGGWLIYQRLAQDVTQFQLLSDALRDQVMGISQDGEAPRSGASPRGHA